MFDIGHEKAPYSQLEIEKIKENLPVSVIGSEVENWLLAIEQEARLYLNDYINDQKLHEEAEILRNCIMSLENISDKILSISGDIYLKPACLEFFLDKPQQDVFNRLFLSTKVFKKSEIYNLSFKSGAQAFLEKKFIIELAVIFADMGGKISVWGKETKKEYSLSPFMRFVAACVVPITKKSQHKNLESLMEYCKKAVKGVGKSHTSIRP